MVGHLGSKLQNCIVEWIASIPGGEVDYLFGAIRSSIQNRFFFRANPPVSMPSGAKLAENISPNPSESTNLSESAGKRTAALECGFTRSTLPISTIYASSKASL